MNRYYFQSRPLFKKSEKIKENVKSKNIIFLRLAFFEKVKSVWNQRKTKNRKQEETSRETWKIPKISNNYISDNKLTANINIKFTAISKLQWQTQYNKMRRVIHIVR